MSLWAMKIRYICWSNDEPWSIRLFTWNDEFMFLLLILTGYFLNTGWSLWVSRGEWALISSPNMITDYARCNTTLNSIKPNIFIKKVQNFFFCHQVSQK